MSLRVAASSISKVALVGPSGGSSSALSSASSFFEGTVSFQKVTLTRYTGGPLTRTSLTHTSALEKSLTCKVTISPNKATLCLASSSVAHLVTCGYVYASFQAAYHAKSNRSDTRAVQEMQWGHTTRPMRT